MCDSEQEPLTRGICLKDYTQCLLRMSPNIYFTSLGVLCVSSSLLPLSLSQCPLEQFPYFCSPTKARMFIRLGTSIDGRSLPNVA